MKGKRDIAKSVHEACYLMGSTPRADGRNFLTSKVSAELEKSLELAHESIKTVTVQVDAQEKTISELEKGVNNLTKSASFEKERTIKLGSHSRRNNLIFFGIPEEVNETSVKTESLSLSL